MQCVGAVQGSGKLSVLWPLLALELAELGAPPLHVRTVSTDDCSVQIDAGRRWRCNEAHSSKRSTGDKGKSLEHAYEPLWPCFP